MHVHKYEKRRDKHKNGINPDKYTETQTYTYGTLSKRQSTLKQTKRIITDVTLKTNLYYSIADTLMIFFRSLSTVNRRRH